MAAVQKLKRPPLLRPVKAEPMEVIPPPVNIKEEKECLLPLDTTLRVEEDIVMPTTMESAADTRPESQITPASSPVSICLPPSPPAPVPVVPTGKTLKDLNEALEQTESESESEDPELSEEQKVVLEKVRNGENLFITGAAGTGKSLLLRAGIKFLRHKHGYEGTMVCAPMGIAAIHVGGFTLHYGFSLGYAHGTIPNLVSAAMKNQRLVATIKALKCLVIDEISTLLPRLFLLVSEICQGILGNDRPFGGLHVIICGDFFQLPPVLTKENRAQNEGFPRFCFELPLWRRTIGMNFFELKHVFRQGEDARFCEILQGARYGKLASEHTSLLRKRLLPAGQYHPVLADLATEVLPTVIVPTLEEAARINRSRLDRLPGEDTSFIGVVRFVGYSKNKALKPKETDEVNKLMETTRDTAIVDPDLRLRVGAQVMLMKNLDVGAGLANGTCGKVTRMEKDKVWVLFKKKKHEYPIVAAQWDKPYKDKGLVIYKQIPLRLGWAMSIHKSQGITVPDAVLNLGKQVFEAHMAYVALSRVQKLNGVYLTAFDPTKFFVHEKVKVRMGFNDGFHDSYHKLGLL